MSVCDERAILHESFVYRSGGACAVVHHQKVGERQFDLLPLAARTRAPQSRGNCWHNSLNEVGARHRLLKDTVGPYVNLDAYEKV